MLKNVSAGLEDGRVACMRYYDVAVRAAGVSASRSLETPNFAKKKRYLQPHQDLSLKKPDLNLLVAPEWPVKAASR